MDNKIIIQRIAGVGILIAVVFLARQSYYYLGKSQITVTISPIDAAFTIDGKAYAQTRSITTSLSPGKHLLSVSPDGFVPVAEVITVKWQTDEVIPVKLQPKQFKQIFKNLAPDASGSGFSTAQEKFFLNYSWAAAYIITDEEGGDPAVAVLNRVNGAWNLVLFSHQLTDADQGLMPPEVFDHIKDFRQ